MTFKRPEAGIGTKEWDKIVGQKAKTHLKKMR